jgi:hypothetical protein
VERAEQLRWLVLGASVAGALVWLAGLWGRRLELDGYGLLPSLGPAYWVGTVTCALAFLAAAWTFPRRGRLVGLTLALFVATLYLTPLLLEGTARFHYSYVSLGYADYIARHHEVRPDLFVYHNWPAFHLGLALLLMAGLSPMTLLIAGPIVLTVGYIVAVWVLARLITRDDRLPWVVTGLYVVISQNSSYLVPQNPGVLLALTAVILSLYLYRRPEASARRRRAVTALILLLAALTVATHLLASVYLLLFVAALAALQRFGLLRLAVAPVLTVAVFVVSWQLYVSESWTFSTLPDVIDQLLRLDGVYSSTNEFAYRGSVEHQRVVTLRIAVYAAAAALAAAGWLLELRRARQLTDSLLLVAAGIAVPSLVVLLTTYNGEVVPRAVGMAVPFLALGAAYLARSSAGRGVLAAFIMVLTVIYPVYAYGNELVDYVSPAELRATDFILERIDGPYRVANETPRTTPMGQIEDQYLGVPRLEVTITGEQYEREARFWGEPLPLPPADPACSRPVYDRDGIRVYVCDGS